MRLHPLPNDRERRRETQGSSSSDDRVGPHMRDHPDGRAPRRPVAAPPGGLVVSRGAYEQERESIALLRAENMALHARVRRLERQATIATREVDRQARAAT